MTRDPNSASSSLRQRLSPRRSRRRRPRPLHPRLRPFPRNLRPNQRPAAKLRERRLRRRSARTLLPRTLGPRKRKAVATPKFYFFDVGVANSLVGRREVPRGTPEYRCAFEHLVVCEVRVYLSYRRLAHPLTYWRTREKHEVDLIVGEHDLKSLRIISHEAEWRKRIVVSDERAWRRTADGNRDLPGGAVPPPTVERRADPPLATPASTARTPRRYPARAACARSTESPVPPPRGMPPRAPRKASRTGSAAPG